jgi:hypothetical protein
LNRRRWCSKENEPAATVRHAPAAACDTLAEGHSTFHRAFDRETRCQK